MTTKKNYIMKKIAYMIVLVLVGFQILTGFLWMFQNIAVIPSFGDTTEYLELSQTFAMDEYRPVLYPLILRVIQGIGNLTGTPYQTWLYVIQTLASFFSIFYAVIALDMAIFKTAVCNRKRRVVQVIFTLYLLTIPMITFMNFTVLTDSLANSLLLLLLSNLVLLFVKNPLPIRNYIVIGVSYLLQALLRADRLYSCLLLVAIVFLVKFIKDKKAWKRLLIGAACICILVPAVTKGIDSLTQTPGINGRIKTNMDFVLLDRIVWPNMETNYDHFSEEIKSLITREDAHIFDEHNNNVMYQMAPLIESKVGSDKAGQIYREMAAVVFKEEPMKVLGDIGEDMLAMLATPVSSWLNTYGLCVKGDSWNIECMSTKTGPLTRFYNHYYQYTFFLLLLIGLASVIYRKREEETGNLGCMCKHAMPFWVIGIILTLWFCIGDGASPNDRYALIVYINWGILTAGLLGYWKKSS